MNLEVEMKETPIIEEFFDERTGEVRYRVRDARHPSPPLPALPEMHPQTKTSSPQSVRMLGFLFVRLDSPLAKKEIIPSLEFFHERSGEHVDFYCPGYESLRVGNRTALIKNAR
jgi:hypothetical protein